ncbi:hypothetical protein UF75_5116 [Desulfosporosinus sp. I2]|nr:hypothetical protein [Desulfosporosinus sp. I2]KJR44500.1 hypothetical protein UF75_5116 [Desulfosporosinus sp. I2]
MRKLLVSLSLNKQRFLTKVVIVLNEPWQWDEEDILLLIAEGEKESLLLD